MFNSLPRVSGALSTRLLVEPLESRLHFAGTGLKGEYFDRADLTNLRFSRTDATVNFDWGTGSADGRIAPDTFSVRWTGQVQPAFSQTYRFYARVNDGVRLWVNGKLLISQFHSNASAVEYSGTIALQAGQRYSLKMEFLEQTGAASARLSWSSPSTPKAIIPKARLYPSTAVASGWQKESSLPVALAETAGGIIGNKLYLVGEGSSATFAYDLTTRRWQGNLAKRPFVGDHHAAEVFNGKLYLFGGFNGGSSGKVQIYNPATNSWTLGQQMPFAPGSAATARIGNEVYVAGGIVGFIPNQGGATTTQAAKYNLLSNTWTPLPSMPRAVHHTAAATDGQRFWIFGGRGGRGGVENGFGSVQVFDPASSSWRSSDFAGSGIAPLPFPRSGMGKAVFHNGSFYVIGGETKTGTGATANNVYNRVDIYNPTTNAWRIGPNMPTARHGIFPLLSSNRIYVAAGGVRAGASKSTILEVLNLV